MVYVWHCSWQETTSSSPGEQQLRGNLRTTTQICWEKKCFRQTPHNDSIIQKLAELLTPAVLSTSESLGSIVMEKTVFEIQHLHCNEQGATAVWIIDHYAQIFFSRVLWISLCANSVWQDNCNRSTWCHLLAEWILLGELVSYLSVATPSGVVGSLNFRIYSCISGKLFFM